MFAPAEHDNRASLGQNRPPSGMPSALVASAAIVAMTLTLSGCSAQSSEPVFRPAIEWGGTQNASLDGNDVSTSLRLTDKGRAEVVDFPRGTTGSETSDGETYACLDRSSASLFSGLATWVANGAGEVDVKFGKSSVPVFADTDGYIGRTADWGAVRISECGPDADGSEFILEWVCGYVGKTDDGDFTESCRN